MKRDQESRLEKLKTRPYLKTGTHKKFMGNFGGSRPQTTKAAKKRSRWHFEFEDEK